MTPAEGKPERSRLTFTASEPPLRSPVRSRQAPGGNGRAGPPGLSRWNLLARTPFRANLQPVQSPRVSTNHPFTSTVLCGSIIGEDVGWHSWDAGGLGRRRSMLRSSDRLRQEITARGLRGSLVSTTSALWAGSRPSLNRADSPSRSRPRSFCRCPILSQNVPLSSNDSPHAPWPHGPITQSPETNN